MIRRVSKRRRRYSCATHTGVLDQIASEQAKHFQPVRATIGKTERKTSQCVDQEYRIGQERHAHRRAGAERGAARATLFEIEPGTQRRSRIIAVTRHTHRTSESRDDDRARTRVRWRWPRRLCAHRRSRSVHNVASNTAKISEQQPKKKLFTGHFSFAVTRSNTASSIVIK
jgi:hypothetical protein